MSNGNDSISSRYVNFYVVNRLKSNSITLLWDNLKNNMALHIHDK